MGGDVATTNPPTRHRAGNGRGQCMSKKQLTPEERKQEDEEQLALMADLLASVRALGIQRGVNWYEALVKADEVFAARQARRKTNDA